MTAAKEPTSRAHIRGEDATAPQVDMLEQSHFTPYQIRLPDSSAQFKPHAPASIKVVHSGAAEHVYGTSAQDATWSLTMQLNETRKRPHSGLRKKQLA